MTYIYGASWSVRKKRTAQELTEDAARDRFASDQLAVTKLSAGEPVYTLTLGPAGSHVRIDRYDATGSVVESFDYSQVEGDDRLFLDNYKTWVYPDDATEPQRYSDCVAHKAWVFWPDGTATSRESVKGIDEARVTRYSDLDVSGNWRERPTFGDWEAFGEHPEPVSR